jgi:hypothetical protein
MRAYVSVSTTPRLSSRARMMSALACVHAPENSTAVSSVMWNVYEPASRYVPESRSLA